MTYGIKRIAAPLMGLSLAACAQSPYQPVVDGQASKTYHHDLAQCRTVAQQAQKDGSGAMGGAVVGGLIGAADGGDIDHAVAGALIGGLIGSAEEVSEVDSRRNTIVFNCMRGRGHAVVG